FKLDESNFDETLGSLNSISKSIHGNDSEMSQARLAELFAKIFDQYLRHCTAFKAPNAIMLELNKLTRVEDVLLANAPEYIQDRIKALRDIRTKSEWFLLSMVKCRSFLASCQQQTTPFLITNSSIFSTKMLTMPGEFNDINTQPCGVR
ncbi:MAG: hypothetical protein M3R00_10025, partial [Pseudomonadota bacterium]|nr:hypothetical protein [Pseudomonadota bacterium]